MSTANQRETDAITVQAIADALQPHGLIVCGAFNSTEQAPLPALPDGQPARALVLVGNAGSALWPVLSASPEHLDDMPDALDRWSQRVGERYARQFGAHAVYPFAGPPYQPFLNWARRCQGLRPSRLGLSIHPEYGLWHAYRFALLLPSPLRTLPPPLPHTDICARCESQACLEACPVDAFSDVGYAVDACVDFLHRHADAGCHSHGCDARLACPVGAEYRYQPAHARFHMAAFVRARTPSASNTGQ